MCLTHIQPWTSRTWTREIAKLFSLEPTEFDRATIEAYAAQLISCCSIVVVRCGEYGSLTISPSLPSGSLWLPAFHSTSVVDATGAGNAFLGGFVAGWIKTGDVREASMYGAVAASFVVEQVGLPKLTRDEGGDDKKWNDVVMEERLAEYQKRVENGTGDM